MVKHNFLRTRIWDNHYLGFRSSLEALRKFSQNYARGKLLDIGCGDKPMKDFFSSSVSVHVGLDHQNSLHNLQNVDVLASAYNTKQSSSSYDTVLCTAVLEHLEEPERALREAWRVLKPGGYAIYTVPLYWHLHEEPRDFYRYTKYGLRYLFTKAGFRIVLLYPCGGFWVTTGSMLNYYVTSFAYGPLRYLVTLVKIFNNLICAQLDRLHKVEKFTCMYLVIAQKAADK